jgi:putative aldouronate transport system permease protein
LAESPAFRKEGLWKSIKRHRMLVFMALPAIVAILIFKYGPMFGLVIAFKDYKPWVGVLESEWVGFYHFRQFFSSVYFVRLLRNTTLISFGKLLFGFPVPIIFAILLTEVRVRWYQRTIQTVTYFPHFLSWVVVGGFFISMLSPSTGLVNIIIQRLGGEPIAFMLEPSWFRPIAITTSVWKEFGWQSIVFLAAIAGIDPQLYEAARVDGAKKLQEIFRITLPQIIPIAVILLVLRIGHILSEDFQQILMLIQDNPILYDTGDVIETYVYRVGIVGEGGAGSGIPRYSYAAAVGFFKSFIGMILVLLVNRAAKLLGQEALW